MKKRLFLLLLLVQGLLSCQTKNPPPGKPVKTADYKKAESFLYRQNDSAYYYFNKVVAVSKDSLQIAMAYNNMAVIQSDAGDYFGSQESLATSLRFLDEEKEKNYPCLSSDYNELGVTNVNLKNYEAALPFYDQAIRFTRKEAFKRIFLNNKALALEKKGDYVGALALYRSTISQTPKNGKEYARILSNMARTRWLQRPGYNAAPELLTALRIRQREKDLWGQNASYAHLADYYAMLKPDSAFRYAGEMYRVARLIASPDDQLEALQKLVRLGPPEAIKGYFFRYQQLSDSLQAARNAAKNQFAFIRYDVEKNKADKLKFQRDNTEKKYQLVRQRILLYGLILAVLAGVVFAVFWYRKRKQRLELEAQRAISEHQFRTSKKVHDVVANGLYRIMSEIEYQHAIDKEQLLDRIEVLYEQSRDISYEKQSVAEDNFQDQVTALLMAFANAGTKVGMVGNARDIWENVSAPVREEVLHILQELMVNMAKHSQAAHVVVRFAREENKVEIHYADDGLGFPAQVTYGNGLRNTGNRIDHIHGAITFDTSAEKGLQIQVSFPVA
ncbi:tetratricopeptide repeat-containing sensor histidine kinase [Mucilaginibacter sp. SG564]|uniref:tetratricopeptide repeat-containing sensor histidine kinase n=1 Tax=Mucilaginibacter sp. SG564 TaxID=2587022 RepID=UPI0020A63F18|nr:tetratricopeptide repeat-containing sensor histidine kinase [Mucilaginibacter sp. SG564]NOW98939.1 tetratricopeptide (TPR) repeat protein [Mucilaginibacter sp. SG564]